MKDQTKSAAWLTASALVVALVSGCHDAPVARAPLTCRSMETAQHLNKTLSRSALQLFAGLKTEQLPRDPKRDRRVQHLLNPSLVWSRLQFRDAIDHISTPNSSGIACIANIRIPTSDRDYPPFEPTRNGVLVENRTIEFKARFRLSVTSPNGEPIIKFDDPAAIIKFVLIDAMANAAKADDEAFASAWILSALDSVNEDRSGHHPKSINEFFTMHEITECAEYRYLYWKFADVDRRLGDQPYRDPLCEWRTDREIEVAPHARDL